VEAPVTLPSPALSEQVAQQVADSAPTPSVIALTPHVTPAARVPQWWEWLTMALIGLASIFSLGWWLWRMPAIQASGELAEALTAYQHVLVSARTNAAPEPAN
jgi:hypothetical protein